MALKPDEPRTQAAKADAKDDALYSRVFVDFPQGKQVLADLVARFYDINIYAIGGEDAARETQRRAARREVVHFILRRIGQVTGND